MVVVIAASLQHLVNTQHVGLVAVVAPAVAALYQDGILIGEDRVGDWGDALAVFGVELLLGILHQIVPRRQRLTSLGITRRAEITAMVDFSFIDIPVDVGRIQGGCITLAVELHGT